MKPQEASKLRQQHLHTTSHHITNPYLHKYTISFFRQFDHILTPPPLTWARVLSFTSLSIQPRSHKRWESDPDMHLQQDTMTPHKPGAKEAESFLKNISGEPGVWTRDRSSEESDVTTKPQRPPSWQPWRTSETKLLRATAETWALRILVKTPTAWTQHIHQKKNSHKTSLLLLNCLSSVSYKMDTKKEKFMSLAEWTFWCSPGCQANPRSHSQWVRGRSRGFRGKFWCNKWGDFCLNCSEVL